MTSKCGKKKKVAHEAQPSVSLMFLPHFDVFSILFSHGKSSLKEFSFSIYAFVLCQSSDEGLTLETAAFQSLYGGQFTLSTPLINQIFVAALLTSF